MSPGGLRILLGALLLVSGCGNSLSSLQTIQESQLEKFEMTLNPDYGRRGSSVSITVTLDPALKQKLAAVSAYPTDISFGKGTFIQSFAYESADQVKITIFVDPLAEEGMRRPALSFSVDGAGMQALGKFWILPALSKP